MQHFKRLRELGRGAHGICFAVEDDAGSLFCLKVLQGGLSDDSALKEAHALSALRHPNVVSLLGEARDDKSL